jgi:hypothetical protein
VILVKTEVKTVEDDYGRRLDDVGWSSLWLTILVLRCMLCDVDYRQWRQWSQVHGRSHSLDLFLSTRFAAILLIYQKSMQEL